MTALLECQDVTAGYARRPIVRKAAFSLAHGEVVALIGANGAGKTTLLSTIAGYLPLIDGRVLLTDADVGRQSPDRRTRAGLVLVPESRALFRSLTVRENLRLAQRKDCLAIGDVIDLFPQLGPRQKVASASLSGGEQQMLALARAIIQRPKVLLIDEMTMGLSPRNSEIVADSVRTAARATSTTVLLVEQHLDLALRTADRALVLVHGEIVLAEATEELLRDTTRLHAAYFGAESGAAVSQHQSHGQQPASRAAR